MVKGITKNDIKLKLSILNVHRKKYAEVTNSDLFTPALSIYTNCYYGSFPHPLHDYVPNDHRNNNIYSNNLDLCSVVNRQTVNTSSKNLDPTNKLITGSPSVIHQCLFMEC